MTKGKYIQFNSHGDLCRGWLYLPSESSQQEKYPCVIMAHGLGGTTDAGLEPYAERFSEAGFAVILFDYRYFGRSAGRPRQLLTVKHQMQDWNAAVEYAMSLVHVDNKRVALWGTSFSSGHVIRLAASGEFPVKAVVAQNPMVDGFDCVKSLMSYAGAGYLLKLSAKGLADQIAGVLGLKPVMIPVAGSPGEVAALSSPDALPGIKKYSPEKFTNLISARMTTTLIFNRATTCAKDINCPILVQGCKKDVVTPNKGAVKFAEKVGANATLKQYDIGHFDIYVGKAFEQAVSDQLVFFEKICVKESAYKYRTVKKFIRTMLR